MNQRYDCFQVVMKLSNFFALKIDSSNTVCSAFFTLKTPRKTNDSWYLQADVSDCATLRRPLSAIRYTQNCNFFRDSLLQFRSEDLDIKVDPMWGSIREKSYRKPSTISDQCHQSAWNIIRILANTPLNASMRDHRSRRYDFCSQIFMLLLFNSTFQTIKSCRYSCISRLLRFEQYGIWMLDEKTFLIAKDSSFLG